ncbi:DUF2235 domain-containing protein [Rhizobium sp. LjRoot258]|uniref:DUF2235 domain-containing protein n=1 Tax=Rhizobium sp. LjRoot258 TaxID=3342299 RepID=UPI003ECDBF99
MEGKRIILLLDGTWNDQEVGPTDTNIVRLQAIIARSIAVAPAEKSTIDLDNSSQARLVSGYTSDGRENIVYYERGVGTNAFDRIRGGAFGDGLALKVRRAYKFLSYHYAPGDEIFIFGFSRGAYTARSLVGYLGAAGLLTREHCSAELEPIAWSFYRTNPNDRLPGTWYQLEQFTHDRDKFRVDCIAVFDTVGALGVPLDPFFLVNRDRFAFHNVDLSSITKVNLHAVAIDEHRKPFEATLWRKPKFKHFNTVTEQVWFSGAHADIGGGYVPEEMRNDRFPISLDDIALDWLIKRLSFHFPKFPCDPKVWRSVDKDWALAPHHEPRRLQYKLYPRAFRAISNYPIGRLLRREVGVSRDRHSEPIGEMVHMSTIERLGRRIMMERTKQTYAPKNLVSVLERIVGTYSKHGNTNTTRDGHDLIVVNWCGQTLDSKEPSDREAVLNAVAAARSRLR